MMAVLSVLFFYTFADKVDTYLVGSDLEVYFLLLSTLFILFINSQLKNVILEFLNTFFVFFYIMRIPFLFSDSVSSDVLTRDVNIDDIPWYLMVLATQYLFFSIAIIVVNPKISKDLIVDIVSEKVFKRVLFFCFVVIFFNILRRVYYFDIHGGNTLNFFWSILGSIFSGKNILMALIILLFVSGKNLISKYKYIIFSLISVSIMQYLYGGSKSIFFELLLLVYLASLVVHGPLKLKLGGLILMLLGGFIAIFSYFFGIVSRAMHLQNIDYNIINVLHEYNKRFDYEIFDFIDGFSYRVGYLDFFLQKVSNPVYGVYVNFQYYFESIIDRITPGFDIFGVPFTTSALYAAFTGNHNSANSEFVTVFGEGYIIFGFFSFFFYSAILLLIKYFIFQSKSSYTFNRALFRLFIMMSFYLWLRGPGLDMVFLVAMYKGIFVIFLMTIVKYDSVNFIPRIRRI